MKETKTTKLANWANKRADKLLEMEQIIAKINYYKLPKKELQYSLDQNVNLLLKHLTKTN